jgi:hypothetical protein
VHSCLCPDTIDLCPDTQGVPVGTLSAMPRPATGKSPKRSIRVPDAKWEMVKAKAAAEGKTVSDVVNECLDAYLNEKGNERGGGHPRQAAG